MNNWNNFYPSNNWPDLNRINTNISYVTSLEEALSRSNTKNSENVFFHQDLPIFYRIKVETDGRKYWQEFSYDVPKSVDNTPVVKQDLLSFDERLKNIEKYCLKEK